MYNITKYRKAQKLVPDLVKALVEIENALNSLNKYKHFYPVLNTLDSLYDAKILLAAHLKEQQRIINTKGEE